MSSHYIHTEQSQAAARTAGRLLSCLYGVGILASLAYLWWLTWNQYESVGTFRVSREQGSGVDTSFTQLVLPGVADSGASDAQLAIGYIQSSDLLLQIERNFHLKEHFSRPTRDRLFRLEPDASLEDRLKFYRSQITAHFVLESGQTTVSVRTFDPVLSQQVAESILRHAETFVNGVNKHVADQQLAFVREELQRAVGHVNEVNEEILAFQNKHRLIDPDQAISVSMTTVHALQGKRIEKESQLTTLLRDAPESPVIPNLRSEIRSIQELMDIEMAKLSGPEQDRLNQILVDFRLLQQKLALATQLRTSAEVLLEQKRIEALSNSRFFSVVQTPYLPEEQAFPRRPYATAAILALGLLGYLILRAIIQSVIDRN